MVPLPVFKLDSLTLASATVVFFNQTQIINTSSSICNLLFILHTGVYLQPTPSHSYQSPDLDHCYMSSLSTRNVTQ